MTYPAPAEDEPVSSRPLNADYTSAGIWRKAGPSLDYEFVTDVAVGADDRLYALVRKPGQVLVYEPDGTFVRSFGREQLGDDPHGLFVAGEQVHVADQFNHVVRSFTTDGKLTGTLGALGQASDTGVDDSIKDVFTRAASIRRSAPPFNRPTNVAVASNGDIYVSDGYGNSRIHRFSADGRLLHSWGSPGPLPGQFWIAHHVSVAVDGRVLVVDHANERIQVFTPGGKLLDVWSGLQHPSAAIPQPDGTVLVGELTWQLEAGSFYRGRITVPLAARISLLAADGRVLRRSVDEHDGTPFRFKSPHGMAIDSRGSIYVADLRVARNEEPQRQMVQKFLRRAG